MPIEPAVMLRVDRGKRLHEQPGAGHNRWHPEIPPIAQVEPDQVVGMETIDAMDGEVLPEDTAADAARYSPNGVHPLTGPILVKGAEAGDLLEIKILEIVPQHRGFTSHGPGFGILQEEFGDSSLLVHWKLENGFATSNELPGVRIPACCHVGVMGVAPSHELLRSVNTRERALAAAGAAVNLPDVVGAVPADPRIAAEAWRTISPHETGGNLDIKQLGAGATLRLPVYVKEAIFSAGDAHFAQGDGEVCGTAIEMAATVYLKFAILKGLARSRKITDVQFYRESPALETPRPFFATTGQSPNKRGPSRAEDLTMATKNALLNMIDYLVHERRLTRQQAYVLCSVAVDLKISQVVDVPNCTVSALLPLDIFV